MGERMEESEMARVVEQMVESGELRVAGQKSRGGAVE